MKATKTKGKKPARGSSAAWKAAVQPTEESTATTRVPFTIRVAPHLKLDLQALALDLSRRTGRRVTATELGVVALEHLLRLRPEDIEATLPKPA